MRAIEAIPIAAIRSARDRIAPFALRTPLLPLNAPDAPAAIFLKLENLQPIGSFKLRGAGNAVAALGEEALRAGIYTASAGNMAQGVAWAARQRGIPCTVIVPETAPRGKLRAIRELGADIVTVPFEEWWRVIVEHAHPDMAGRFIHPVSDPGVIAGNGTIGLEILEDLPDVDTVIVPFGGGGLATGIASAIRSVHPRVRVLPCEVETAAPLAASLAAGAPRSIERRASFVDGIGGKSVLAEMWPLIRELLHESLVMSLDAVANAVRLLVDRNHLVAEGAGATPVAAALAGRGGGAKVVCVVSGGNIDVEVLAGILEGTVP